MLVVLERGGGRTTNEIRVKESEVVSSVNLALCFLGAANDAQ